MSGEGIGGALGSAAALALAPETGGTSLAALAGMGALGGAAGSYLGGKATGSQNGLRDALMGGVMGGLSGGVASDVGYTGIGNMLGNSTDVAGAGGEQISSDLARADPSLVSNGAADIAGAAPIAPTGSIVSSDLPPIGQAAQGATGAGGQQLTAGTQNFLNSLTGSGANETTSAALQSADPSLAQGATGAAPQNYLQQAAKWAGNNPLTALKIGGVGAVGLGALLAPKPAQISTQQNAANVMATNPSFNAALPKYSLQNTGTPYAGNWNTYGQTPQAPMYNGQFQALKEGGKVHGYADGGAIPPQAMPPIPQPQAPIPAISPQGQPPVNPLALAKVHQVGVAIGKHLREHGYNPNSTPDGKVLGKGGGQDDLVPAKLSQDEYIIPADVTSQLGDGSSNAGAAKLDQMVKNVRQHKATKSFPPKAKNPLSYIPKKA